MRKMKFEYDAKEVENYIMKLQKKFPQYNINVNNANDFSLMLDEKNNCKNCLSLQNCKNANQGYYTDYQNGQFILAECHYKQEKRIKTAKESLIKTLYLPDNILRADLASFDIDSESRKKIYNNVVEFVNGYNQSTDRRGMYLYGTFSIGKTYALACIANELARNNISCLLIYFPDLVVDLKNAIGSSRFESLINMLKSIDVLMLDDLGSENITPWLRDEILGPVLNYRVLERKPLFISSNLSPQELQEHLKIDKSKQSELKAQRIVSRIQSLVKTINMDDGKKYKR